MICILDIKPCAVVTSGTGMVYAAEDGEMGYRNAVIVSAHDIYQHKRRKIECVKEKIPDRCELISQAINHLDDMLLKNQTIPQEKDTTRKGHHAMKIKLPNGVEIEEEILFKLVDLDLPEANRTEACLWKAKYFQALKALREANVGIARLHRREQRRKGAISCYVDLKKNELEEIKALVKQIKDNIEVERFIMSPIFPDEHPYTPDETKIEMPDTSTTISQQTVVGALK